MYERRLYKNGYLQYSGIEGGVIKKGVFIRMVGSVTKRDSKIEGAVLQLDEIGGCIRLVVSSYSWGV